MLLYRPQYVVFPQDEAGFEIDDQYWIGGSGLLVKPVTKPGVKDVLMHLSDNQVRTNISAFALSKSPAAILRLLHPLRLSRL